MGSRENQQRIIELTNMRIDKLEEQVGKLIDIQENVIKALLLKEKNNG